MMIITMIIKNNDNNKYEDLEIEIKKTLKLKSTTVPVVIGALRLVAYVAGVKGRRGRGRGRGRGNLGARGRKERNACKNANVFSVFHAQILSVKIVIGQN